MMEAFAMILCAAMGGVIGAVLQSHHDYIMQLREARDEKVDPLWWQVGGYFPDEPNTHEIIRVNHDASVKAVEWHEAD